MRFPTCVVFGLLTLNVLPAQTQTPGADIAALQAKVAKGDAEAELDLGRDYHLGTGVPKDYAKALDLYQKAAAQGNAKAMYNLGYMYDHAQGVSLDLQGSAKWFQKASDLGLPAAQLEMGLLYQRGQGVVVPDYAKALKLLTLAYDGCTEQEQKSVAANALGLLYNSGWGVPKDSQKALDWYLKAANQEDTRAQFSAGCIYFTGAGMPKKDLVQAYKWIKLAAFQGNFMATHMLSENLSGRTFTPPIMAEGTRQANEFLKAHGEDPIPPDYRLPADQVSAEALLHYPNAFAPPAGSAPASGAASAATNAAVGHPAPATH